MISRYVTANVSSSSFYYLIFFILDKHHTIRRLCHDRRPSDNESRFSREKEAALKARTYGWTDYRSSFKKRVIALWLHVTRLTRSRAYIPVKSDGYCIAWSINDRACFTLLHADTCDIAFEGFISITKINAK